MTMAPQYRLLAALLCVVIATACAGGPRPGAAVAQLAPLQLADRTLAVAEVADNTPTPGLLQLDDAMRGFVARYVPSRFAPRQRLTSLHEAVKGPGALAVQYDPFADGTASEVFHSAAANCLSYAHLFVALAREAGLDARYHWLEERPQWTRLGERVAVRLHVNVIVRTASGEQYMVDIEPLQSRDVAGARVLDDSDAAALHHNNLAMEALAGGTLELAWRQAVRALQLSPGLSLLWVNLGAVYRHAGQLADAEQAWLQALQLDDRDRSAMNNLVLLYDRLGREQERLFWLDRVEHYRQANPYWHAWQGDQAGEADDWEGALPHYQRALELAPDDNHLLYAAGIIHFRLGQYEAAGGMLQRAIDAATRPSDIRYYRAQLQAVQRQQLAGHQSTDGLGSTRM
ncbi:transglutaminase-like domain-containing protein [Kineobactrum salinum]|uniref:Tetratricopeptide repeat protein n=1 Tax=Kineobactrum salinum TaxID=2708301 RepID=A0A6C0U295_9GAMM|nr:transglutaminase family protein [Kineobactrum salinum]QIB66048.1 tetratricopeptide repeat protein [Kineobactrum salinum]